MIKAKKANAFQRNYEINVVQKALMRSFQELKTMH
jgi:hypothetical protein